jgi:RimJ/RimL family protein N-acetyltransferase
MILTKGNIRFIRIREEDLELVRHWRNSPRISQFMEFREYITPEMQLDWFRSVNDHRNMYLIIEHDYKKIGLINAKEIDWQEHSLEGGIFFWEEDVYSTPVPAITSLIFAELVIRMIRLKIYAHILRTNDRAIRYNRQLGFRLCEGQEGVENQKYLLTPESYLESSAKLRKAFYILIDKSPFILNLQPEDYATGIAPLIEQRLIPEIISSVEEKDGEKIYRFKLG